jgi:Major capsid protein N-terminus
MPGGLLNLVSSGQPNVIFNSNPSKTFFKCAYKKYTNFGMQQFRIDYEGSKQLSLTEETEYVFKIKRYADLLMDTYLSVELPNIWSPILPPINNTTNQYWAPYEFKWIENIGAKMIKKVSITCGNQLLNEYSGNYLLAMAQRDFSNTKLDLFNRMIGQIPELVNPAFAGSRNNVYPNAFWNGDISDLPMEPSINSRILYIPLNTWFTMNSQQAFPLIALQYNELQIKITFRPINQLFQIRDVMDQENQYPYVAPNFNQDYMQFYRFTQPPPDVQLGPLSYTDKRNTWNPTAIYLQCTYGFLSEEERIIFAKYEQKYLFKKIYENVYHHIVNSTKVEINSLGMVASSLFYFQRSDANLRNEWSNYTNWPYNYVPDNVIPAPTDRAYTIMYSVNGAPATPLVVKGPGVNINNSLTGWFISNTANPLNDKNILVSMGILFDGSYRENMLPYGVYNLVEKYNRTSGNGVDGLLCYNYGLNSTYSEMQPSGAINMSRFNTIEFEVVTINPPVDELAQTLEVCDPETFGIIGVNKPTWRIYQYTYDMYYFEERYNMITFVGGNCALLWAS